MRLEDSIQQYYHIPSELNIVQVVECLQVCCVPNAFGRDMSESFEYFYRLRAFMLYTWN
jgi:hypothetical protein